MYDRAKNNPTGAKGAPYRGLNINGFRPRGPFGRHCLLCNEVIREHDAKKRNAKMRQHRKTCYNHEWT